ncbi:hypothetical protein Pmani_009275 [Petrolisthes manimaculis]|uniref:Uncharacterized protein n=1 Tax=Petrolisthes manimaculis TaxID=1843537 RepID=A0AAE1UI30_9EUCA|nr:hypothetical protein Pmani_009275 [Petrolisthes manimaculis]
MGQNPVNTQYARKKTVPTWVQRTTFDLAMELWLPVDVGSGGEAKVYVCINLWLWLPGSFHVFRAYSPPRDVKAGDGPPGTSLWFPLYCVT